MRRITIYGIRLLLLLLIGSNSYSQSEKFDIVTYTPLKDWKKEIKQGVVNYTNVGASSFCVVALFASSASTGDPQADFVREWKELVITPYNASSNPHTAIETTDDGWKAVVGTAPVKMGGVDVNIVLTVFSGFGKTVSVRIAMNDETFNNQVDAFLASMTLNKTVNPVVNNPTTIPVSNEGTGKFGLMIYSAPEGWSEQKFSDGVVFKPLDLPAAEHLAIQIMSPLNFSGSLEQALSQSFAEATTMYKGSSMYQSDGKYSKNASKKSFNGWEYLRGKGGIRINDGTQFGTEYGLEVFVVKINNRFERVAILESRQYCKGTSLYYTTDRRSYRNGIEHLLFSLQFTDSNIPALQTGALTGNGIVGLWQGIMQSTSAAGLKLEVNSPIFLPNGQVFFGSTFPIEGLYGLNTGIPPELNRRDWASYTFSNGKGVLMMPYGNIPFRVQGNQLIVTKNQTDWPFTKLPSVDGATFNGTYQMGAVNGKIPSISFTSGGKFSDNGALKELYHEYINCLNPALTPGSGSYVVKDYTILFNYSDGRKIKLAFLGAGYDKSNPSPPSLRMSFNEDPMQRQ